MIDVPALLGILAFAGVLIGILAGSRGQKILDRRNAHNHRNNNPGRPCAFDREAWDELWRQERDWRGKLWEKHDFLEDEIKDNRTLLREELKGLSQVIREGQREIVAAIGEQRRDLVSAIREGG